MKAKLITTAAAIILTACNSFLLAKETPAELTADGPVKNVEGVIIAEKNVHFKYDVISIQADQIEYHPKTGEVRVFKKADSQATQIATLQILPNSNQATD